MIGKIVKLSLLQKMRNHIMKKTPCVYPHRYSIKSLQNYNKLCHLTLNETEMGQNEERLLDFLDFIVCGNRISTIVNMCYSSRRGESYPEGDSEIIRPTISV